MISPLVRNARALAAIAHAGQLYRGRPYLCHVMRVARRVRLAGGDDVAIAAAYLHDTLEDTPLLPCVIEQVCGADVLSAVRVLTRREAENYFDYIARVGFSPIAAKIKVADLRDHLARHEQRGQLRRRYIGALGILEEW